MAQGFPSNMKLKFDPGDQTVPEATRTAIAKRLSKREVSDLDLKHMAGNTMTVGVIGILQVHQGTSCCS